MLNAYVNIIMVCLNTQEVYDFIEKIKFYFFHRKSGAKGVNDSFATIAREIYFDAKAEALFGDKNSGKMRVFFKNTEGFEIFKFVEFFAFFEAVFFKGVLDFTGRTGNGNQDSNNANDDEGKKSPRFKEKS